MRLACIASVSSRVRRECWDKSKKKMNDGGGGGGRRKRLPTNESIFMSRVPCRGSRVTIVFIYFFILKMKNKWRGGGRQNTLLDNLRTSSALLTSHVKNVVKKCKKTDLTDTLLSK